MSKKDPTDEFFEELAEQLKKLQEEDPEAFKMVQEKAEEIIRRESSLLEDDYSVEEMREMELSDENYIPPSFDPRTAKEEMEREHLSERTLEFMQGLFFWKCIVYSGSSYKPTFNKHLYESPEITGEIKRRKK